MKADGATRVGTGLTGGVNTNLKIFSGVPLECKRHPPFISAPCRPKPNLHIPIYAHVRGTRLQNRYIGLSTQWRDEGRSLFTRQTRTNRINLRDQFLLIPDAIIASIAVGPLRFPLFRLNLYLYIGCSNYFYLYLFLKQL